MIVVSDTSPISNLIVIDRLDIVEKLFAEIIVPPTVDNEIRALQSLGISLVRYDTANWIRIIYPRNKQKVIELGITLDKGESEAIAIALEIGCNLLLMDERMGTRIARKEGLKTVGLAGILLNAKREQIVSEVRPLLRQLRERAGFWLGEQLEQKILDSAGEI